MRKNTKTVVVIAGPTAVGKTAVAIDIARRFETEIISADSRQFYKGLKIGTAAPTTEELKAAPHHFIAFLEIDSYYNVSMFEQQALKKASEILENNRTLIVAGGSGLYINAFCHGIDDLPDADEDLRNKIKNDYEKKGLEWLQGRVRQLDPEYYDKADKKNPKRLMRALEVCISTGKTFSELRKATRKERPFEILKIALNLPREQLFARINERVDKMMEAGLEKEARSFYPKRHLNALNTVGYKELFDYFDGKISKERAIENIKTNTRRYAKRQITWFKKDPEFQWFSPFDKEKIIAYVSEKLEKDDK